MNHFNPKKIKAGSGIGFILLILGVILTIILIALVFTADSLPRILIAGPCFIGLSIGMILFPGGKLTIDEIKKDGAKRLWLEAPIFHRLAWIVLGGIGLSVSFYIMTEAGFL